MESIIKVDKLTFRYKDKFIFDKFSLEIKKGEWISISGPNGSGKSTLIKILSGLINVESDVNICGLKLNKDNIYKKDIRGQILNLMHVNNLLKDSKNLRNQIIFEPTSSNEISIFVCHLLCRGLDVKTMMLDKVFGKSGDQIVIEEFLEGPEVSVLSFTDGKTIVPMISSMDHKRAGDNDTGLNTGGMGTIAPNPYYTEKIAITP